MESIDLGGMRIAYAETGAGEDTVIFSHSFLVDHRHFAPQIEALSGRFRVVAYDHRDHGASGKAAGPYGLEDLVADAVATIERTASAPCHFVGLSTGGFVGLRLALDHPHLVKSLVLMDTSADREPWPQRFKYEAMFQVLRAFGFGPLIKTTMGLMLSPKTLGDPARRDEVAMWRDRICANDRTALVRFGRAIFGRTSVLDRLGDLRVPTLVVVGADDKPQPLFRARQMADRIAVAQLAVIPDAGHLATVDAPEAVTEVLAAFFEKQAETV